MIRYLTTDELIYINEQLPVKEPIHKILQGRQKVRDMDLLETAVGRPMQTVFGEDAYPTLQEKAAALLHSIARNHPFADGNKRTATVAAIFMLQVNGLRVNWEAQEALSQILNIAEGRLSVGEFAAWLPTLPGRPSLDEDAEADMQAIRQIIDDHRWLLDELEQR
ncbi:MAG TPA: type II toxin-antitoxin system death-on-curing family toxin [Spirillospora sp.]|nr:type II toxin-antitoxin system death-on-curing family toxin [Spirillospora sp.]